MVDSFQESNCCEDIVTKVGCFLCDFMWSTPTTEDNICINLGYLETSLPNFVEKLIRITADVEDIVDTVFYHIGKTNVLTLDNTSTFAAKVLPTCLLYIAICLETIQILLQVPVAVNAKNKSLTFPVETLLSWTDRRGIHRKRLFSHIQKLPC